MTPTKKRQTAPGKRWSKIIPSERGTYTGFESVSVDKRKCGNVLRVKPERAGSRRRDGNQLLSERRSSNRLNTSVSKNRAGQIRKTKTLGQFRFRRRRMETGNWRVILVFGFDYSRWRGR